MIYLNNKLVPRNRALISVFDHGFLYGDGIYETLRAYEGVVFMFDQHMERLYRSASLTDLGIPMSPDAIKRSVYKTLKANRLSDAVIRITVSRGAGPLGLDPGLCPEPTFVIFTSQFRKYPEKFYLKGVRVAIADTRRNYSQALDPRIKSLSFLNNVLAKIEAKKKGTDEAVMLNYRGYLAEGTISNIFFVKDRVLCTPSLKVGILDGITRRTILDAARELQIETCEGSFKPHDIHGSQEAFISSTTMEVMPVAEISSLNKFKGPGRITRLLQKAYKQKVADYTGRRDQ
jgi:branched-chain amino acid aminotransferase